jgi:hypothetical protein
MNLDLNGWLRQRWFRIAIWAVVCLLSAAKFLYLTADFPNWSPWMIDQAKFTDEGWWGSAAVAHAFTGHWYMPGDYNPAVALPVWPLLLSAVFHFTGVSAVAARAFTAALSIAALGLVYLLVRRYARGNAETPALLAVLLLAASPFAFVFNRLAICLLMLVASFATLKRIWPLAALAVLIPTMLLTKTTAALLVPAVAWVAWSAMGRKWDGLWRATVAVAVVPAALLKGYAALASALGYGADYRYFYDVNAMPDIDWAHTLGTLRDLAANCLWVDRVLYPIGLVILLLTVAWKRKLWANPLFAASWMVIAAQAVFIFSRQDDSAPRYFLPMLAPLVWIVVLAVGELLPRWQKTAALLLLGMAASVVANVVMIRHFLVDRDYDFHDAAVSISQIIRSHSEQKPLMLGVSGAQIALMTGIPAINDGFSSEDMAKKVAQDEPGWFLVWDKIDPEDEAALAPFRMEEMASYPAFDDDTRTVLILYKLTPKTSQP